MPTLAISDIPKEAKNIPTDVGAIGETESAHARHRHEERNPLRRASHGTTRPARVSFVGKIFFPSRGVDRARSVNHLRDRVITNPERTFCENPRSIPRLARAALRSGRSRGGTLVSATTNVRRRYNAARGGFPHPAPVSLRRHSASTGRPHVRRDASNSKTDSPLRHARSHPASGPPRGSSGLDAARPSVVRACSAWARRS